MSALHRLGKGGEYTRLDRFFDWLFRRRTIVWTCRCGDRHAMWVRGGTVDEVMCYNCRESAVEARADGRVKVG